MKKLGFPRQYVQWILAYVQTVSYKFSINGSMSQLLIYIRGLSQGDPISPLLFVLDMEYLHIILQGLRD